MVKRYRRGAGRQIFKLEKQPHAPERAGSPVHSLESRSNRATADDISVMNALIARRSARAAAV